jgi:hypothetical protein
MAISFAPSCWLAWLKDYRQQLYLVFNSFGISTGGNLHPNQSIRNTPEDLEGFPLKERHGSFQLRPLRI